MEQYTYLLLDLGAISIPFLFSFHPRIRFDKEWSAFWPACSLVAAVFIAWDVAFTSMGIWGFNPRYLIGTDVFGLPLEEWLFFICIPYACMFTYYAMSKWSDDPWGTAVTRVVAWGMAGILLVIGVMTLDQWYTSTTFISLSILLAVLARMGAPYLGRAMLSYTLLLIPFALLNGVLTGNWIEDQVVWYNDVENLGIRMGTIPVEDTFYGMLLILLNVVVFEGLRKGRAA